MTDKYLLHGKLKAKAGHNEALAAILLQASELVGTVKGCHMYLIGRSDQDPDAVYVTEIWDSKEDHDNSLNAEGVRELIMKAMPLLEGPPTKGQELDIIGGSGI